VPYKLADFQSDRVSRLLEPDSLYLSGIAAKRDDAAQIRTWGSARWSLIARASDVVAIFEFSNDALIVGRGGRDRSNGLALGEPGPA